jgi:hypothetical protein
VVPIVTPQTAADEGTATAPDCRTVLLDQALCVCVERSNDDLRFVRFPKVLEIALIGFMLVVVRLFAFAAVVLVKRIVSLNAAIVVTDKRRRRSDPG